MVFIAWRFNVDGGGSKVCVVEEDGNSTVSRTAPKYFSEVSLVETQLLCL